jgi:Radical SAM superfamily
MTFTWTAEARVEAKYTRDTARFLADSGCRLLVAGIETGSKRVSALMAKGIDVDQVARWARDCRTVGILTGWMFFTGFPTETEDERLETFKFIRANRFVVDFASVGVFELYRGAPAYEMPARFGIKTIHCCGAPYMLAHDYTTRDGEISTFSTRKADRDALLRRNADMKPIFAGAFDRLLSLFSPRNCADWNRSAFAEPLTPIEWNGAMFRGAFDLDTAQLHLEKSPGT